MGYRWTNSFAAGKGGALTGGYACGGHPACVIGGEYVGSVLGEWKADVEIFIVDHLPNKIGPVDFQNPWDVLFGK